jgi:hypothetical protein
VHVHNNTNYEFSNSTSIHQYPLFMTEWSGEHELKVETTLDIN